VTRQQVKNQAIFFLVGALSWTMQVLPLDWSRKLGAALGRLFFSLVPHERRKALASLVTAFPEKSVAERRQLASAAFASLGRGGAEFLRFPSTSATELCGWVAEIQGWDRLEPVLATGRGLICVTAHLGNWEVVAARTAQLAKVAVVAQRLYDPRFDEALNAGRRKMGITVFPRNTSVRPILKWLKEGGVLGALCDQDTNVDSVFVDFFGRPAKTPSGPAWLASMTGAALVTAFIHRQADGRYAMRFSEEIPVPRRSKEGPEPDLSPVVQEYTRHIEAAVREHPEQWVWMHERWRSRPGSPEARTGSPP
jgi:KDO2-lipid IV(A) lauroyltransferase